MANFKNLRIVYMGTPEFAVEPLRAILDAGMKVCAVVTVPDKPAGRGQKISESAVKQFARERELPILQPEKLKDEAFVSQLRELNPDVMVVVAFRMLPEVVWRIPRLGTFNLHASLLPQYRGAAPINWAVINGETHSGLTTFLIDEKIDTGSIIMQEKVEILPNETAGELHDKLLGIGGNLVVKTVETLANGEFKPKSQNEFFQSEAELKPAPKIFKETCRVNWNNPVEQVHNFIRGLSPYPTAWTEFTTADGSKVSAKIFRSSITEKSNDEKNPGTIQTDGSTFFKIKCADGYVSILEIQLAGKRNLAIKEFLKGFRVTQDLTAL
jgi:methionyl-tRNA formyltransferase